MSVVNGRRCDRCQRQVEGEAPSAWRTIMFGETATGQQLGGRDLCGTCWDRVFDVINTCVVDAKPCS